MSYLNRKLLEEIAQRWHEPSSGAPAPRRPRCSRKI